MSDLINRQDAIDAINHICPVDTKYDCALLDRVDVRYVLSDLQSAEPERTLESAIDYLQSVGWLQEHDRILTESAESERKKGKWIYDTERVLGDGWTYRQYHCSVCNAQQIGAVQNFCPHCGADMRGEWLKNANRKMSTISKMPSERGE